MASNKVFKKGRRGLGLRIHSEVFRGEMDTDRWRVKQVDGFDRRVLNLIAQDLSMTD